MHLPMLRLNVDTIVASFPSNFFSRACIVWLKLSLVIGGLVSIKLCIACMIYAISKELLLGLELSRLQFDFVPNHQFFYDEA